MSHRLILSWPAPALLLPRCSPCRRRSCSSCPMPPSFLVPVLFAIHYAKLLLLENGGFSLCCLVVPWVIYLGEAELVPDPDSRVLKLEIVTKLAARCTEAERTKPIISELDWMLPTCCLLSLDAHICELLDTCACPHYQAMATFELYRQSTIDMCLTETLEEMVSSGTLSPELAIQVLIQLDKFMTEEMENQVNSKATVKSCCCYDHVLEPGRSGSCRERRAMMRFRVAAPTLTSRKICSRSRKLGLMEYLSLVFVLTL